MTAATNRLATSFPDGVTPAVPDYLSKTYAWAYLSPLGLALLDRRLVVSAILWGHSRHLRQAVFEELRPGQRVLQAACVYGDFSPALARFLGLGGRLDVVDIVPLQVVNCQRKLKAFPHAVARLADAAAPGGGSYDAVCCFFLLHELPESHKRSVVDGLLASVAAGGKAVFVDYQRPHFAHPLRGVMSLVFDILEPFAKGLWHNEIAHFASFAERFVWRKQTYFGGLYQKVVVCRRAEARGQPTARARPRRISGPNRT